MSRKTSQCSDGSSASWPTVNDEHLLPIGIWRGAAFRCPGATIAVLERPATYSSRRLTRIVSVARHEEKSSGASDGPRPASERPFCGLIQCSGVTSVYNGPATGAPVGALRAASQRLVFREPLVATSVRMVSSNSRHRSFSRSALVTQPSYPSVK